MQCQNPDCSLAGSEHEHMLAQPSSVEAPKPPLATGEVRSIAKKAADKVMKYWIEDFMKTHGDSAGSTKKEVLRTVAYSLDHFAEDTSVQGILGVEEE
jgi:hypothetical protein